MLDEIQSGFPIEPDPYSALAKKLSLPRERVLEAVESLRSDGSIRKICGSVASRDLGCASTLCALTVDGPQEDIDRIAGLVSAHDEVTHNYLRNAEFNIWFTPIASSQERLDALLQEIQAETGCEKLLNLPVTEMFKIRVDFGKGGQLDAYVGEMSASCGITPRVLLSTKEYKKSLPVLLGGALKL